jgi:Ca2+/Na+ antiporter
MLLQLKKILKFIALVIPCAVIFTLLVQYFDLDSQPAVKQGLQILLWLGIYLIWKLIIQKKPENENNAASEPKKNMADQYEGLVGLTRLQKILLAIFGITLFLFFILIKNH